MSVVRRLLCCCLGGGDLSDLKRVRPPKASTKNGKQPEFSKGKWKDNQNSMKADVDLDAEGMQATEPDVITSHKGDDSMVSEDLSKEGDVRYTNTVQLTVNEKLPAIKVEEPAEHEDENGDNVSDCESLPDVADGEHCDVETSITSIDNRISEPIEEETVQTRMVKEVHMTPERNLDRLEEEESSNMKHSDEVERVTSETAARSSRSVAMAGLTLSIDRGQSSSVALSEDINSPSSQLEGSASSAVKKRGSRKLFQLRHSSTSDTAPSPDAKPVDRILLVRSLTMDSDSEK